MTDDLSKYVWHTPEKILRVINEDHDVIAYGVPYEAASNRPLADADADAPYGNSPLPQPKHITAPDGECLSCEWVELKNKIEAASGGS